MLNMHISRYVTLHRSLGRKYSEQDRMLRQYAAYAEGFGDQHTQVQRIYDWCHTSSSQYVARRRFDTARNFSLFAHAEDSGHEVPPAGVFGRGKRPRPTPTIIEPDQVRAFEQDLQARLHDPRFYYGHAWQQNDVVIADNFSLLHGREAFTARSARHLQRVHIHADPLCHNTALQPGA